MPIVDNELLPDYDYPLDNIEPIPVGKWLRKTIQENLDKYGDSTFMTDYSTGRSITYSELLQKIRSVGSGLWKRGLRPGDSVLLMAANYIETAVAYIGILQCGGVVNALTLNVIPADIRARCERTNPKFAITDSLRAAQVVEAFKGSDKMKEIFVIDGYQQCTNLEALLQDDGKEFPEDPEVDLNSSPVIVYSSGTTGTAKAILIDHFTWRKLHVLRPDAPKALLNVKNLFINPMVNAGGWYYIVLGLVSKAHLIVISDFSDDRFIEAIDKSKPTVICAFPTQLVWMCKKTDLGKYDMSSVQLFICGGGIIPAQYEKEIWNKLPNMVSLFMGYGMTETGTVTANSTITGDKKGEKAKGHVFGSVGRVNPNCRLKVVNEKDEKLGPNQEGQLVFKTPGFMKGYMDNPEATRDIFRDGWCYSGDCGYYDEEGNVYVTGRIKELVKYRMAHVVPANIEKHLLTHPAVAEAVVIGLPDDVVGELPLACVVKTPGAQVEEQELIDMIAGLVPDEEKLRGGVCFVDQIPRNDWGKPMRRFLLETVLQRKQQQS